MRRIIIIENDHSWDEYLVSLNLYNPDVNSILIKGNQVDFFMDMEPLKNKLVLIEGFNERQFDYLLRLRKEKALLGIVIHSNFFETLKEEKKEKLIPFLYSTNYRDTTTYYGWLTK